MNMQVEPTESKMTAQEALEQISHSLHCMIEGDTRTMTNPETEDGLYYKGIYDCIKVVEEYTRRVTQ